MPSQTSLLSKVLLLAALGWAISFVFTFSSWSAAVSHLQRMGAEPIEYQPLLDYWLKMASATFGCIGVIYYLVCALDPPRHADMIQWLSCLSIFVGLTLLVSSRVNHLTASAHPAFCVDIVFCLGVGSLSLFLNRANRRMNDR